MFVTERAEPHDERREEKSRKTQSRKSFRMWPAKQKRFLQRNVKNRYIWQDYLFRAREISKGNICTKQLHQIVRPNKKSETEMVNVSRKGWSMFLAHFSGIVLFQFQRETHKGKFRLIELSIILNVTLVATKEIHSNRKKALGAFDLRVSIE